MGLLARRWSQRFVISGSLDWARRVSRAAPSQSSQVAYSGAELVFKFLAEALGLVRGFCRWWKWRFGDRRAEQWSRSRSGSGRYRPTGVAEDVVRRSASR